MESIDSEEVSIIDVLSEGPISTSVLRSFAVWCAERVRHLVEASPEYDLDPEAPARFTHALEVAAREARGCASPEELEAARRGAVDQRSAGSGWWPGHLADAGAFRSAAHMAARFACRGTCQKDAAIAAILSSQRTAWAVGYLAASTGGIEDQAVNAETAEHIRELRRRMG